MRPRTPTILWIPFLFGVGGISWALLLASLALLAGLILAPIMRDVRAAEARRNDMQATVEQLDQLIALQDEFTMVAQTSPQVMARLASRQLQLERRDQEVLVLERGQLQRDRSVRSLLAESQTPVAVKPVEPLPWYCEPVLSPSLRPTLMVLACGGLLLSFVLGVRVR